VEITSNFANDFTEPEIQIAIQAIKTGKSAGFDEVYPEFLKNCGPKTRQWLATFFTNILRSGRFPKQFKKTKILAISKSGKPDNDIKSFRPISLLSVNYKILVRLIYNRIAETVNNTIPIEQAGFRPHRNCCDQVLSLTANIEDGFEKGLKSAAVFIDLTAAYDTVWRDGLITKLLRTIPCKTISGIINNMLSNRLITVVIGDRKIKQKTLNNGLPQGSVLAPLLFNLYTSDLPNTKSNKFIYVDDIALLCQEKIYELCELQLTEDLSEINKYCKNWRLIPNSIKTEVTLFHLNNRKARQEIKVIFNKQQVRNNPNPTYLGITLDRTLTYREHLTKVAAKIKTRNSLINKLAQTTWGSGNTIRISALALTY